MKESDLSLELEDPSYLTLGISYEERGRFAGGAYHPLLRRVDWFLEKPVRKALEEREMLARRLLEVDDLVAGHVQTGSESSRGAAPGVTIARVTGIRFPGRKG